MIEVEKVIRELKFDAEEFYLDNETLKELNQIFARECLIEYESKPRKYSSKYEIIRPYLETFTHRIEFNENCPAKYLVRFCGAGYIDGKHPTESKDIIGYGKTLPHAACIAIIRYYRKKEDPIRFPPHLKTGKIFT